jgi:hypothetical protein
VRVTDDEGAPEFVGLNMPPGAMDPRTGEPVQPNQIAQLDVDIILDSVPDTANIQAEAFQQLSELAKLYGPQEVPFDDLLFLSPMQGKRDLMERRKARSQQNEEGQQNNPAAQLQMQAAMGELQKLQAEVDKLAAEADLTRAKTESELARPHIEAAKIIQGADQHAMGLGHQAFMKAADQQHAGDMRGMELQHDAAKTAATMAQSDDQFAGQLSHAERLAQMKAEQGPSAEG